MRCARKNPQTSFIVLNQQNLFISDSYTMANDKVLQLLEESDLSTTEPEDIPQSRTRQKLVPVPQPPKPQFFCINPLDSLPGGGHFGVEGQMGDAFAKDKTNSMESSVQQPRPPENCLYSQGNSHNPASFDELVDGTID